MQVRMANRRPGEGELALVPEVGGVRLVGLEDLVADGHGGLLPVGCPYPKAGDTDPCALGSVVPQ